MLLLHGTGAATHSWRDVAPLLARDFTVVAPDLPGHGFTETPDGDGLSLNGMAREVAGLLEVLKLAPEFAVGHSAGAAIALRMALDHGTAPRGIVSLNGALQPFPGSSGALFPVMAKLLFLNPLAIRAFAWRASQPGAVSRLIEGTGSNIDAQGLAAYTALFATPGHVAGALGMMARWDLIPLQADLGRFAAPLTLVAAEGDKATPPAFPSSSTASSPPACWCGCPASATSPHEEAPEEVAEIVRQAFRGDEQRRGHEQGAADHLRAGAVPAGGAGLASWELWSMRKKKVEASEPDDRRPADPSVEPRR